jgi:hypothetical protein
MRILCVALIGVLCVVSLASKTNEASALNVRDRLDKIRDDDFGKKILETIAL